MFNWFKRREGHPAATPNPKPDSESPARASPDFDDEDTYPAALPEIVAEGNSQADWNMWEDSMSALDSKMRELMAANAAPQEGAESYSGAAPKRGH